MTDKLADLIDRLNEFGGQYEGFVISIAALATVLALLATVLTLFSPLLLAWLRKPKRQDPTFSNPPSAEGSLIRYNARAIELLGRGGAMEKLRAFLLADEPFLWMQIAGVGGQGKSRLGYELILWAQQQDWRAGLLDTPELQGFAPHHWPSWQPRQPHLLVLDYVIGREEEIKPVLQSLSKRATALRRPVRLLLLERQRWDRGGLPILDRSGGQSLGPSRGNQGRAEWYLKLTERYDGNDPLLQATRYKDGLLELEHLEQQDLVAIVRRIARLANSSEIALSDDIIAKQLQHIDADGRPLYAYLLGQALADGADPSGGTSGPGWRRDDLLDNRLHRDQGSRWRQQLNQDTPCLGDGSDAERLAVIATIAGGLDCAAAARAGLPIPAHDAATRRSALILTDGPLGTGPSGPSQQIPPLQPDLLGAWFVLRAFDQGLPIADCLDLAWRHGPKQTAAFVLRIAQDFPEQPMSIAILEQDPPEGPATLALAGVAAALIWHLHRARRAFPPAVIKALAAAAADGDGQAMANLGFCYAQGQGVERHLEQAVDWYRKGAEAGNGRAMANLGFCYQQGQGVERDLEQAVDWYRKGAAAGDGRAMANLGVCYEQGHGVERDLEQAVDWYRKGAEAGDGRAMAVLGFCYEQGQGVERDWEIAFEWYRKGMDLGEEMAAAGLRRLQSVKALLSPASEPKPAIVDWARRHGVEFCSVPWADVAPMPGDWQDLIGADAIAVLVSVGMQLEAEGLDNGLDTLAVQRLRRMPLPFYRDCSLVDIQLQRDGQDMPLLTSALVSSMGAAMLNGTSNLFHAINQDVLTLTDDETTIAYLRFFCTFFRGEDGPFLIVDEPRALPIDHGAERATLAPEVQAAIQPPRALDGTLDSDGWRRFECSLLYGRALFHAILKVAATGMVDMEGDKQIAADLPIRERRYDGIFRTPLLNSPGG
jgi:hypothetical protein